MAEALLTQREAADRLGLSPRFLEVRRYRGDGPRFVKVSSRCVRYRPEALDAWIEERERTSTSDPGRDADLD